VTAADCAASIRRWAVRSGTGQLMIPRMKDVSAKDDKDVRHFTEGKISAPARRAVFAATP